MQPSNATPRQKHGKKRYVLRATGHGCLAVEPHASRTEPAHGETSKMRMNPLPDALVVEALFVVGPDV